MNTDELESALFMAERRVLKMQAKLHCWATDDSDRRFDDLFNLVADPAFLLVAWDRVRSTKGARSAGVDGYSAYAIEAMGVEDFLDSTKRIAKDRYLRPVRCPIVWVGAGRHGGFVGKLERLVDEVGQGCKLLLNRQRI